MIFFAIYMHTGPVIHSPTCQRNIDQRRRQATSMLIHDDNNSMHQCILNAVMSSAKFNGRFLY